MTEIVMKPSTPPRQIDQQVSALLTPPPTGGFPKRIRFEREDDVAPKPKRLALMKYLDPFDDEEETLDKDSDVSSIDEESGNRPDTDILELPLTSPISISTDRNPYHKSLGTSVSEKCYRASLLPECIDFMKLPLRVRKKVYGLLLTVPALICLRQNRTPYDHYPVAFSNVSDIKLLPGAAMVLTQSLAGGPKSRFHLFPHANASILRTNSKVYSETKKFLYGSNTFEFLNLTKETAPPADFSIPIFYRGYAKFLKSVCIRGSGIYAFRHMITSGHVQLKNHYRSVESLTLILEIDTIQKGYGRKMVRMPEEKWMGYIKRLLEFMGYELFDCPGIMSKIPSWIHLKVVFQGDRFTDSFSLNRDNVLDKAKATGSMKTVDMNDQEIKKDDIRRAASEAFELFKRGRR